MIQHSGPWSHLSGCPITDLWIPPSYVHLPAEVCGYKSLPVQIFGFHHLAKYHLPAEVLVGVTKSFSNEGLSWCRPSNAASFIVMSHPGGGRDPDPKNPAISVIAASLPAGHRPGTQDARNSNNFRRTRVTIGYHQRVRSSTKGGPTYKERSRIRARLYCRCRSG